MKEKLRDDFDRKWQQAMKNAYERFNRDKTISTLIKKYNKLQKKLAKIENEVAERKAHIFYEEIKKLMTGEK